MPVTAPPLRLAFRQQVRETALGVTHDLVVERGWDGVRLGEVARLTGVSRPTLYKEFGDRQGLGEALLLRETERFLVGVREVVGAHGDDPSRGIRLAVVFTLEEAARSPLLHAVLTSTRADDAGLVPLLARSVPLLRRAVEVLVDALGPQLPDTPAEDLADAAELLVRLCVSHLVQPSADVERTALRLARTACRYLSLPES
ncbi:MAG: TetR family transcriptional regulator [Frankiales bacterium]|nr:TetR family transcriptional regulator [Frankiales bacterium]